ncbi:PorP/SprF family type IX secretion system membrane protein [Mesonia aestuariivivens]|uniref:Type IX secretion system membrane protein PorP/SprF n=1 Tax=Mesonia aestuariivivens TaxID=2796128 RepID=A0ABS6W3J0_9FLAO|nr:type IX secretion system membrane protein PorP/SprF [Mesonia aestuariivivens]MBW2962379.1 type IX secretion system membrane protein PorP/SprF [Mesonia aestuariivivens]
MKLKYIHILFLFFCAVVQGQQISQFSQYMYNTMSVNPGYTGTREVLSVVGLYRNQWVGIDGAPQTLNFSAHTPLGGRSLVNLGLDVVSDRIGASNQEYVAGNFSYILPLDRSEETRLSFGVKAGIENLSVDINQLLIADVNDPLLFNTSEFSPVVGMGAYLYTDQGYLGISTPNLLQTKRYNDIALSTYTNKAHIYFIGGYVWELNRNLKFKPAFLVKSVSGAPLAVDLSANFYINDKLTLGASYRLDAAVSAVVGFQISEQVMLGYAYDYETTELSRYNSGSHEVLLRFELWGNYRNRFRCF